ncbi:signal transduction histidine kinase [Crossiella equi]|uniref:Signal transduction histidine kinase n=1 Tax=Crossiella equi TaxID=130796 RepID=A0ABS5AG63_9PSEU|nr:signal transduction histidine kinase [Crossiella equi]
MGVEIADRDTAAETVMPLWRALVWLRVVTLLFAFGGVVVHHSQYQRQWLGWLIFGVMVGWTAFTVYCYTRESGRRTSVVVADVVVTSVLLLSCLFVHDRAYMDSSAPTVVTVWASGCMVAAAVLGGRRAGMAAGALVAGISWLIRARFDTDIARDTVLLIGIGFMIGLASSVARKSAARLHRALQAEAANRERERLARQIHDGVLQVLARVRRRGRELGGEAAELAELAGEQEISLRSLVASAPPESTEDGDVDLRPQLQLLATPRFQVSAPATQVLVPAHTAAELCALTREALSNVDEHAGPAAKAWVLLEDLGEAVVVSIRDDGPGIAEGRIGAAEAEGRMGIAKSIRGRVEDLRGTLCLHTAPGEGTEWEVRVPRQGKGGRR